MNNQKRPQTIKNISKFIETCYDNKPDELIMDELKWKLLVRSVLKGKNTVLLGPTGSAKTMAARCVAQMLGKEDLYFPFNLGATQDPRSTLIGNTHFNKKDGTVFNKSVFVQALQTEGAIILLDEITRAHPDAWNILMTVLDDQRYLRLDEHEDTELVKVADGVTFIATANVGNAYTATRTLDRAIFDRFGKIEVNTLDYEGERKLLGMRFPDVNPTIREALAKIASQTRELCFSESGELDNFISTRCNVEACELASDGFSLQDIAEACYYPEFDPDGGNQSERTFVKQLVQKYIPDEEGASETAFNDPTLSDNDTQPF
jgi:hypothetical protein